MIKRKGLVFIAALAVIAGAHIAGPASDTGDREVEREKCVENCG